MKNYTEEELVQACYKAFYNEIEQATNIFIKVCKEYANFKNKWVKATISEDHIILAAYKALATDEISALFEILKIDPFSNKTVYTIIKNMSEIELAHFISKVYYQGRFDHEFCEMNGKLSDGSIINDTPEDFYKNWYGNLLSY